MLLHGINIEFDTWTNDYPDTVNVKWYLGNTVVVNRDYTIDSANYFCEARVNSYNKVVLTFYDTTVTNNPYRFIKIFNITDGISREFYNEELTNCEIIEQVENNNKALSINEANLNILPSTTAGVMFQRTLPFYIYRNDILFGKFFVASSTSNTFKTIYKVDVNDYISILEGQTYLGGLYSNTSVSTIISDIMGDIPYNLDATLGAYTITGYLPILNKREALREVAFCINALIDTSRSNVINITPYSNTVVRTISKSEIVSISTKMPNIVTTINLDTTLLSGGTEQDTLYESTLNGTATVFFDAPYYDLYISNGSILSSNCNYAIIQGTGNCILKGIPYTQSTITTQKTNPFVVTTDVEKVENYSTTIRCNDVSTIDSLNFVRYEIKSKFLMSDTQVGDLVKLNGQLARVMSLDYDISQTNIYCDAELEVYYG